MIWLKTAVEFIAKIAGDRLRRTSLSSMSAEKLGIDQELLKNPAGELKSPPAI